MAPFSHCGSEEERNGLLSGREAKQQLQALSLRQPLKMSGCVGN